MEDRYISAIVAFWRAHHRAELVVAGLERNTTRADTGGVLTEGEHLRTQGDIEAVARAVLREETWCKLLAHNGSCEIHFGYEYYVYLLSNAVSDFTQAASDAGLFLEEIKSPYVEGTDQ